MMKIKKLVGLITALSFVSLAAHANWVCNVANKRGQHWTFSAPSKFGAQALAKNICDANSIYPANCNPICYNNGFSAGRWHCSVGNLKGQHWSFVAPTKAQAYLFAKNACDRNSINPNNCNPACVPE